MKIHVKTFLSFWNYTTADLNEITCWKCGSNRCVDLCHVDQKGRGGRESAEYIENYIPLCRKPCHEDSEGNTDAKKELWDILINKILEYKPKHEWSDYFKETWYYKNHIA